MRKTHAKRTFRLRIGQPLRLAGPLALVAVALTLPSGPAAAACVKSGNSVTCSGTTATGFGTGTENNLTLTVQPDASITAGVAQTVINLANGNRVTNNGTIAVAHDGFGIEGGGHNAFTNAGMMTLGHGASGMLGLGNNNTMVNAGTISSSQLNTIGLDSLGTGNTLNNAGTISLTGPVSWGLVSNGIGDTVINSGMITVGGGSTGNHGFGVTLAGGANFINTGTVTAAGDNGVGVMLGNTDVMTNNGMIVATGKAGIGLMLDGQNNTVVNNGIIKGGVNGYSLLNFGTTGNQITNNGTLDGAMSVVGVATANALTNAGLITITDSATSRMTGNLNFAGSFIQKAQGTLAIRVDNTGARDGLHADTVSLNGTLRAVLQPGLYKTTATYTDVVDSAAPVSGQFASVTSTSAFFNAVATYNAQSVDLTLTRYGFGSVPGETANQRSVGNALESGYSTALTGATATFYTQLLQAASLRALDQLSGEGTSGTQNTAFNTAALFGQTMDGQMEAWRAGNRGGAGGDVALGYAAEQPRGPAAQAFAALKAPALVQPQWNAWAAGFGAGQSVSGNANVGSAGLSDHAAGGSIGVDHLVNPDLLVGIAAGGSSTNFSVADRDTSGRTRGRAYRRLCDATVRCQLSLGADRLQPFQQLDDAHHQRRRAGRDGEGIVRQRPARRTPGNRPRLLFRQCLGVAVCRRAGGAVVAGGLYRNQYRWPRPRRARTELQVADRVLTADVPRCQVRRPRRHRQRNGVEPVRACRLGPRIRTVAHHHRLAGHRAGSGVHHRRRKCGLRFRTRRSRLAPCAQPVLGIVGPAHR